MCDLFKQIPAPYPIEKDDDQEYYNKRYLLEGICSSTKKEVEYFAQFHWTIKTNFFNENRPYWTVASHSAEPLFDKLISATETTEAEFRAIRG